MPDSSRPKVFGIGFHKTGTTSLAAALRHLGYRVTGPNEVKNPRIAVDVDSLIRRLVPAFDAFQDNPWPVVFRQLDSLYPGSQFILTTRPTDSWIASVIRHFEGERTPMREWIYGVGDPQGNEDIYVERYERHNTEVLEYFRDRPGDLAVVRLTEGDGWEPICQLLDLPIPSVPFPHENRAQVREAALDAKSSRAESWIGRLRRRVLRAS